jgi:hypothetical protein
MKMQQWCVALALTASTMWAMALPSVGEVEAAVKQGDYAQAQVMMHDVVEAKPGSAKAQYLYAEILAHNGRFAQASTHAAKARELDPAVSFTAPDKFKAFEQMLAREQQGEQRSSAGTAKPAPSAWPPAAAMAPRSGLGRRTGSVRPVRLAHVAARQPRQHGDGTGSGTLRRRARLWRLAGLRPDGRAGPLFWPRPDGCGPGGGRRRGRGHAG